MSLFLALVASVLFLGLLSILIMIPEKSFAVDWLVKRNYYFPYHVLLTTFLIPLGSYGKKLHEKSFFHFLNAAGDLFMTGVKGYKEQLFSDLKKPTTFTSPLQVLEFGIGPGQNFQFYPDRCDLTVVEPASSCRSVIEERLQDFKGIHLKQYVENGAEDMSLVPDCSIDVVVGTLVLCSVKNPSVVLKEVFRVLKPGGKYYFYEHVYAQPESILRYAQEFLNWTNLWPFWMCGCIFHDIKNRMQNVGFKQVNAKDVYLEFSEFSLALTFAKPNYFGTATK